VATARLLLGIARNGGLSFPGGMVDSLTAVKGIGVAVKGVVKGL